MRHESLRRPSIDSLKKEARRWLGALHAGSPEARERLRRVLPDAGERPTLRLVQLALAREHGFAGWTGLKHALTPDPRASAQTLAHYELMVEALLEAYRTGTPEAMERHYRYTWHRRPWQGMRSYVQLDLGRRPAAPDDDVPITRDDARRLVAHEHGFDSWAELSRFVAGMPGGIPLTAKPVRAYSSAAPDGRDIRSRDWRAAVDALQQMPSPRLEANGTMTDAMLADVARVGRLEALDLSGSHGVTDDGAARLAALPNLRELSLNGTSITDRSLAVLRQLP